VDSAVEVWAAAVAVAHSAVSDSAAEVSDTHTVAGGGNPAGLLSEAERGLRGVCGGCPGLVEITTRRWAEPPGRWDTAGSGRWNRTFRDGRFVVVTAHQESECNQHADDDERNSPTVAVPHHDDTEE
jgi:hypothetical protein